MDRSIPYANRVIQNRLESRTKALHLKKLEEIRTSVSRTNQAQTANIDLLNTASILRRYNKKKESINESHFTEIERENRILLEKMSKIFRKNKDLKGISNPPGNELKSLNKVVRKHELTKISNENRHILQRIKGAHSIYNAESLETQFKNTEKIMKSICTKPLVIGKSNQANSRSRSRADHREKLNESAHVGNISKTVGSSHATKRLNSADHRLPTPQHGKMNGILRDSFGFTPGSSSSRHHEFERERTSTRHNDLERVSSRQNDRERVSSRQNDRERLPSRNNERERVPSRNNERERVSSRYNDREKVSSRHNDHELNSSRQYNERERDSSRRSANDRGTSRRNERASNSQNHSSLEEERSNQKGGAQKLILYKKGINIGHGFFIVEFSIKEKKFQIVADDVEHPDIKIITMDINEGKRLVKKYNHNYERMANKLKLVGNKLILDNYEASVVAETHSSLFVTEPSDHGKNKKDKKDIRKDHTDRLSKIEELQTLTDTIPAISRGEKEPERGKWSFGGIDENAKESSESVLHKEILLGPNDEGVEEVTIPSDEVFQRKVLADMKNRP